jgi:radical SAM-linked protein
MIYRPVRERSVERLLSLASSSLDATGYEDISLLSLSTGDYTGIGSLMAQLMERCESDHVALSLPSLRAGTLQPEVMELIKRVRKTGFTLAPEAGSQRLRDVINKNITEADVHQSVEYAFQLGWQLIKLYFMVGLPTETTDDLDALVRLVDDLRGIKTHRGGWGKFNVSIGPFVPKPHTPFQWAPQLSIDEAHERIEWIRTRLKRPGIKVKWQHPEMSFIEGIWSRGDRRLRRLLIAAYERGCRFDGWNDKFNIALWRDALEDTGLDPAFYVTRTRDLDEPLPWDIADIGVDKSFLQDEWRRAQSAEATGDCRWGDCHACGVCDFDTLEPVVFGDTQPVPAPGAAGTEDNTEFIPIQISYTKVGQAGYFGHLELVSSITRAIRRARIPVRYTQGFHPKPKLSFGNPLPVGTESMDERFIVWIPAPFDRSGIIDALNRELPDGIAVNSFQLSRRLPQPKALHYRIRHTRPVFVQERIDAFGGSREWTVERTNPKGKRKILDLKRLIGNIERRTDNELHLVLDQSAGVSARPAEVVQSIFDLDVSDVEELAIMKMPWEPAST